MSANDLQRLRTVGTEATFASGQTLIERGQPGTGLFLILEGDVVVEAPEGVRELGPGAVVGERALLAPDGGRTARVRAVTDVRVVAVPREAFDELCAGDSGFAERIAEASA